MADVLTSRILAKKAGEARDVLAEFRETVTNEKKLEEIDELAEHLDEVAGMAENIRTTKNAELFKESAKKLSKIKPREALKYLDEALPHFNHKIDGDTVVQISDTNCSLIVQKVDEFLKTGKISKAAHCGPINILEISNKYKRAFITTTIPSLKNIMKEGERGIMYGNRGAHRTGHVFNVIKTEGKLKFIDGQSGGLADLTKGYISFKYLKTN